MTPSTEKITIMLVDDHAVVRQGTRDLLINNPKLDVIYEAESGENLPQLIHLKKPDIILLDINLPGKNGLELLELIRQDTPDQKVILFTAHTDIQYIRKGIALKANGYLSKTVSAQELQDALFKILEPDAPTVYSSDVLEKINTSSISDKKTELTPREHEILLQVAQGMTNKDIANTLVLSVKTVDSHVAKLIKKLSVNNRAQLTAYAYKQGLL